MEPSVLVPYKLQAALCADITMWERFYEYVAYLDLIWSVIPLN